MRSIVFIFCLFCQAQNSFALGDYPLNNGCKSVWFPMENLRRIATSLSTFLDIDAPYRHNWTTIVLGGQLVSVHFRQFNSSLADEFTRNASSIAPMDDEVVTEEKLARDLGGKDYAILVMVIGDILGKWKILSPAQYNEANAVKRSDEEVLESIRKEGLSIVSVRHYRNLLYPIK